MKLLKKLFLFLLLAAISLLLLGGIARIQRGMKAEIAQAHLRFTGKIQNAPPLVTFSTLALGSFRGVIADLLWLRSESLKQSGKYFEMVQLAKWIVDLQPNFAGASAFLAWNLAYNVSVTTSDFEQRWRWINEGIRLLRDQAIVYNPDSPKLYQELAWIYQHKLGNIFDDANLYYKNQLAIEMMNIVGEHPDYAELAKYPLDEAGFRRYFADRSAAIFSPEMPDFETLYARFAAVTPAALPETYLADQPKLRAELTRALQAIMLYRKQKLEPARMAELNRKYGDLDWRVPESFAIYWASVGLEKSPPGAPDIDCRRVITTCLYESFRYGRLLMVDKNDFASVIVVPNLDLVDSAYREMLDAQETYADQASGSTFRSARINFMKIAITILFNYGKFQKAQEYFQKLVAEDGPQPGAPNAEAFIMQSWAETVRDSSVKTASELISGLLFTSINYIIYGDLDAAIAAERIARNVYALYMADTGNSVRTQLPPYQVIKNEVTTNCLKTFPPPMAELLQNYLNKENQSSPKNSKEKEK